MDSIKIMMKTVDESCAQLQNEMDGSRQSVIKGSSGHYWNMEGQVWGLASGCKPPWMVDPLSHSYMT
jgi:hypothetical protein